MNKRNAFTLIEVLLAVFIIGLGSIGLFALFAGVASQQTRAAELTRAVGQAQGLLGSMEGRVGPIGEWKDSSGVPASDPVFGAPLVRGVWYPAFAYYLTDVDDPSLTVNPRGLQSVGLGRYFVSAKVEEEIYTNPAAYSGPGPTPYAPVEGGLGLASFNTSNTSGASPFVGNAQIVRLPHSRAALGTVEIEFWKTDTATGAESLAFAVSDLELMSSVQDTDLALDWERVLPLNPMATDPQVVFNYAEIAETDPRNAILAGLTSFDLGAGTIDVDEWISSIRVRYAHRGDRLLGLSERLVTVPDETRPSGRRATVGATAMYRITPRGRSQFVTLAYTVNPLDRAGDFIPPERPVGRNADATNGLLRVSDDYELFYDDTRNEYYITWANDDFALVEGDIVIVGGQLSPPVNGDLNLFGADDPVRVSRVLAIGGEQRAYLDDTPRVLGRSMAVDAGANSLYRVYTLLREVEVTDQDNITSRWELRPVLYQTLDVQ
jgi:prepilin-type N-terminal cleavage/methylation domain-containing protein